MLGNETAGRALSREEHAVLYGSAPMQLNASWRLATIPKTAGHSRGRAWMLQQRADNGAWRDRFMVRAASAGRDLVQAKCGPIDAAATDLLSSF
jgi:hypothetical protein